MDHLTLDVAIVCVTIVVLIALAFLARFVQHRIWKEPVAGGRLRDRTLASNIEYAGYFLGVLLVAGSVVSGVSLGDRTVTTLIDNGSLSVTAYALRIAVYGIFGVLVLALFARLGLRVLVRTDIARGVLANNPAAGIVAAGGHISTALVIAGAVAGDSEGGDFSVTVIFLLAGLAALWLITYAYRFVTGYNDAREITNGNVAAALSYSGLMVSVGMIVGHSLEGNFVDYATSLTLFSKALLVVVVLYPIRQFIVQGILLGGGFRLYGGLLDDEISHGRNTGAGAVEAAAYIASAILAIHLGY
jgi:uncharacterized membrane protein YjfL (UPF0719 family)